MIALLASGHALTAREPEAPANGWSFDASAAHSRDVVLRSGETTYAAQDTREFALDLAYGHLIERVGYLRTGLGWRRTTFQTSGAEAWSLPAPRRLNHTTFELADTLPVAPGWQVTAAATVGWRNAGEHPFDPRGFGATLLLLAQTELSPTFRVAFGVLGDTLARGSQRILPVGGFAWDGARDWRLEFGMPRTGLFYQPNERLEFGLVAEAEFNTYNIPERDAITRPDGTRIGGEQFEYLDARAGLQVTYSIRTHTSLSLAVGVIGQRRFEYTQPRLVVRSHDVDGGFVSLGLATRF